MSILREIWSNLKLSRRDNITAIILSLFAGTIFWFFNALNKEYSANVRYPLTYVYNDQVYQAIDTPPNQILLNMSGVGWNLLRRSLGIKVEPIVIRLDDPSEIRKIVGSSLTSIITDQVDDLSLNYILTDTLRVNFDKKIEKTFPLRVDSTKIKLEDNHFITSRIIYSEDSVILVGPQTLMDSLDQFILIEIPENDIDSDYDEDLPIKFYRQELYSRNPPTINIKFSVSEFTPSSIILPLRPINFPDNVNILDSVYNLHFLVEENARDTIIAEFFEAHLDFLKMSVEDSTIAPELFKYPSKAVHLPKDSTRIKVYFNE